MLFLQIEPDDNSVPSLLRFPFVVGRLLSISKHSIKKYSSVLSSQTGCFLFCPTAIPRHLEVCK